MCDAALLPACTGWAAIGIAWAYVIIWWFLADLAKTIVSKVTTAAGPAVAGSTATCMSQRADLLHVLGSCMVVQPALNFLINATLSEHVPRRGPPSAADAAEFAENPNINGGFGARRCSALRTRPASTASATWRWCPAGWRRSTPPPHSWTAAQSPSARPQTCA